MPPTSGWASSGVTADRPSQFRSHCTSFLQSPAERRGVASALTVVDDLVRVHTRLVLEGRVPRGERPELQLPNRKSVCGLGRLQDCRRGTPPQHLLGLKQWALIVSVSQIRNSGAGPIG